MSVASGYFRVDDEPVEKIQASFDAAEKGKTARPPDAAATLRALADQLHQHTTPGDGRRYMAFCDALAEHVETVATLVANLGEEMTIEENAIVRSLLAVAAAAGVTP